MALERTTFFSVEGRSYHTLLPLYSDPFPHLKNPNLRFANVENAPYAYNAGGVKEVQDRAEALTDPDVLAAAGNGDQFPLYYLERAANGNYLESNEIAKRHGVCGDPRLVRLLRGLRRASESWALSVHEMPSPRLRLLYSSGRRAQIHSINAGAMGCCFSIYRRCLSF